MTLVAALLLIIQSWDRLQGHLSYLRVQDMKAHWRGGNRVPHDRDLNQGFKLGYSAVEYESANSDYRFMLAGMHAWRERSLRLWPDQASAETRKAIENLKGALTRRPSWSEAWILLALVKYQSKEIDRELNVALEKAIETGRYETTVHHGLSFVGPRVWNELDPDLRRKVVDVMRTSLDNPNVNRFVVEQIIATGWEEQFRDKLEADAHLARLMNRLLKERDDAL